ncbi:MAG TPA: helix-turn-helix transcriptional regulator [Agriterribacter sp.]|mgnify:CR=1 FL=1|nr:helix-turn-helix transcriptional regulator [Agriterribacter sp.]HRQ51568.1 helix-turn-helix transcriptional regulator [Agriterribacter sp.]
MKPVSKIDRYAIRKVKEKRIELGYSQAALSYELDVSASYIGQVESDNFKTRYTLERLNEIAKILHCSIHDFLPKQPL